MTTQERPDIDVNKKGVELDANGNPYYKWPPFPDPPENVKIMPFSEFKASGIQISFDDEAEVDGLGIPTVRLPIIHNNEAPPRKKKKTQTKGRRPKLLSKTQPNQVAIKRSDR